MRYTFDTFTVDTDLRELRAGQAVVKVEPKVFDLLVFLLVQGDRVVSKDELVEAIWGGRAISDAAVASAVSAARRAVGDDGRRQVLIRTVHGRGFRFMSAVDKDPGRARTEPPGSAVAPNEQEIRYCRSADGTRIAYASAGTGPPLLKAANWLSHLEFDWESPVWRHVFRTLAADHHLIRFDARGNGLSDWNVDQFGLDRQVEDLEAVADVVGLTRFPILAVSQGCATAAVYAARHPERVSGLILIGGYARGWKKRDDTDGSVVRHAAVDMIRAAWGQDNPAVRQMMTSLYMPDAPAESQKWFSDLQRKTTSAENAARILEAHGDVDVRAVLPQVQAPTLVIHSRHDAGVPLEEGQELATGIPGARFLTLDTANHILPETDPAWRVCAEQIARFLAQVPRA
ncbi:MAG: alpha/beta fold hydrolase [Pseudomonadota bacterium]